MRIRMRQFLSMSDREILKRLDQHMATSNEHMATSNKHMARSSQIMEQNREVMERSAEINARGNELMEEMRVLHVDTRQFMRDLTRRSEIVLGDLVNEVRAGREESDRGRQILVDLHHESVAQRQAILALIDELREHGLGGRG